jgi:acyl-[acyl-carrier-protein]-phospholipid O-acyltransferase/long-chain-fatty-acid--[acyl-carrier-protein] ligase
MLDRVSRHSKIGGEMVPHIKIEQKIQQYSGAAAQVCVVTSVADPTRGERLVVLHTLSDSVLASVLERLDADAMPNLWKPRRKDFYRVDALPALGSGKLDLRRARELAKELTSARTERAPV